MSISAEDAHGRPLGSAENRRAGQEVVLELVFRPLSSALVPVLRRLRVTPAAVVLGNATVGVLGALVLARGEPLLAALLLQVKTLLDNTDGQLARATGRVTLSGRYLDTEADLVVNAALFGALAHVTGQPFLALVSFLVLTLVLTLDFNMTELYREARGEPAAAPVSSGGRLERVLIRLYDLVFRPQDRLVRVFSRRRFERVVAGEEDAPMVHAAALAYHDAFTVTALANLGLSTQLAVLGACLVLGVPALYLWLLLACIPLAAVLQLRRERRARLALAQ